MRFSSRRLNVTRFGGAFAAAGRATARSSLGSVSSEMMLMERLLSSARHDRADCSRPQEGFANTAKPRRFGQVPAEIRVTGSLAESYYCPTSANRPPRWIAKRNHCVGPVLSVPDSSAPSPPGPSGSGLSQGSKIPTLGQRKLVLFFFGNAERALPPAARDQGAATQRQIK